MQLFRQAKKIAGLIDYNGDLLLSEIGDYINHNLIKLDFSIISIAEQIRREIDKDEF